MRTTTLLSIASVLALAACGPAASDDGGEMTMSMKDLVKLGKNYTCTYSQTEQDGIVSEGRLYVQGEKNFRGDFSMMDKSGKKHMSHMIGTEAASYMWADGERQGMMMKLEQDEDVFAADDAVKGTEEEDDFGFNEDEDVKMNCKKWSPDQSVFTPPKNVEFIDFAAQMEGMMKMQGGDGSQCGVCDMAGTEEDKTECRKALGC